MIKQLLLACAIFVGITAAGVKAEADLYVKITEPFANIYEYLNPKSSIIQQAKKGEYFKLVYEGTSWYQVVCKGKTGWLEKTSGVVSKSKSGTPLLPIIITIVLMGGTIFVVGRYIKNQKHSAA